MRSSLRTWCATPVRAPHLPRRAVRAEPDPRRALVVRGADGGELGSRRLIAPAAAASLVPSLRRDGLRAAGLYPDGQTDDARLCIAIVRGRPTAAPSSSTAPRLVGLEPGPVALVRDGIGGATVEVAVRSVVNASGPWIDDVRRLEDVSAGTSVTLSKGAHLVLERRGDWGAALTIPIDRARVAFAVPWQGMLLLGTTDTVLDGDARDVRATDADERQILQEVALAVDGDGLAAAAVRARFAGVRVLPGGTVETARAPRETTLSWGRLGMVSVAGGKLTTYRRIALAVLHALRSDLALHRIDRRPQPLPARLTRVWPRMLFGAGVRSSRRRWRRISRRRTGRSQKRSSRQGRSSRSPMASRRSRRRCCTHANASGR